MSPRRVLAAGLALALVVRTAQAEPPPLELVAVAPSGSMPKGATLSPDGKRFYVANYGQGNGRNVSVYDARTLALVDTIHVPGVVVESVLSLDGQTLYLSNFSRDSIQYVDTSTRRVVREVKVGAHPKIMVLSRDGRSLFAANWNGDSVSQLDLAKGTVLRTLPAGKHPRGMALTAGGTLYIANFDSASIDVYGGAGFDQHHRFKACAIPRHLALSPDDKTLYVSCYHDSAIESIDLATERVTHHVPVGSQPKSIEVTRDGRFVFSADYGPVPDDKGGRHGGSEAGGVTRAKVPTSVSVVDTNDWTGRVFDIAGMNRGSGLAVAADGVHAAVTGWNDNHVYLVAFAGVPAPPPRARRPIFHRTPGLASASAPPRSGGGVLTHDDTAWVNDLASTSGRPPPSM